MRIAVLVAALVGCGGSPSSDEDPGHSVTTPVGSSPCLPSGPEVCDGLDNDCDGLVDDADPDVDWTTGTWFFEDADVDGHGAPDSRLQQCAWRRGLAEAGDDCDDSDEDVSPSALEYCEDGIDNDCRGGDGRCAIGQDVQLTLHAPVTVYTDERSYLGAALDGAGDVNGDGYADILIGAPQMDGDQALSGQALVLLGGPLDGTYHSEQADLRLLGSEMSDYLGTAVVGAGDRDGDGFDDIAVGAPGVDVAGTDGGAAYVLRGGPEARITLADDATTSLFGEELMEAGQSLASGDIDGSGGPDLLVGAPLAGTVWMVDETTEGKHFLDNFPRIEGDPSTGHAMVTADFDGDGMDDLAIGSPDSADGGRVSVFYGPLGGDRTLDDADLAWVGESDGDRAGSALDAADINGNGLPDLAIGADTCDRYRTAAGAVYVVPAHQPGTHALGEASLVVDGNDYMHMGYAVAAPDDLDVSGRADLVVGSIEANSAFLFYDPEPGNYNIADANIAIVGTDLSGRAGSALASAGDVDGDGAEDLLVGEYLAQDYAGLAFLLYGGYGQ